jgi:hypothetical protein
MEYAHYLQHQSALWAGQLIREPLIIYPSMGLRHCQQGHRLNMGERGNKTRNTSQQQCVPGWESNQPVEALDPQIGGGYFSVQFKTMYCKWREKRKWMI